MLRSFLKYVMTVTVLLATSIAGLPLVLCVSEAHSAAIEIERLHVGETSSPESHFVLFAPSASAAEQAPCTDYRLQTGAILTQQTYTKQLAQALASAGGGDATFIAVTVDADPAATHHFVRLANAYGYTHEGRSTLSDRRTIVLQI